MKGDEPPVKVTAVKVLDDPNVEPSEEIALISGLALTVTTIRVSLVAPSASLTVTVSVNIPAVAPVA